MRAKGRQGLGGKKARGAGGEGKSKAWLEKEEGGLSWDGGRADLGGLEWDREGVGRK